MSGGAFKIPYGEIDGELRHISEVDRGLKCGCVCPVCRAPLVARKGSKLQHHFGHAQHAGCSAETVLHQLAKQLLHRRANTAIAAGISLPMTWPCQYCDDQHEGDLVKLAHAAMLERPFGTCRPDLVLLKIDGTPAAFVEIVVTHRPEDNVLAYAAQHRIVVVEFHLRSADELESLQRAPTLQPARVDLCTRPKCSVCGRPLRRKIVSVVDAECWRCHVPMKVALLDVEGTLCEPADFSAEDRALAREHGAVLQVNYSETVQREYLSNTCGCCGTFVGNFYLHQYLDLTTPDNSYATGHMCVECGRHYRASAPPARPQPSASLDPRRVPRRPAKFL